MVFLVHSQIFVMQVFNIRKDLLLYSRLDAMQLIGFLRVFANIRNARFEYSQGFLRVFAISKILPNEMREECISLYKRQ